MIVMSIATSTQIVIIIMIPVTTRKANGSVSCFNYFS